MDIRVTPADPAGLSGESLKAAGIPSPSSFLQTPFWAEFKASHGWKPFYFFLDGPDAVRSPLVVLSREIRFLGSFAYAPMGPNPEFFANTEPTEALKTLARALAPHLPANTLCIRFDPPLSSAPATSPGLRKGASDVQPPDTVVLDLSLGEEALLEGMKPKWRYNVRLGEKKGLEIRALSGREAALAGIDSFYALYRETATRDGIAIHGEAYYRDFFLAAAEGKYPADARLYIASHDGRDIAAIVTLFGEYGATYLYGASSNEKRNLMPAYFLQWRAIRDAMAAGCPTYDFYGIPPTDDPGHPMHGLFRFKTGFGGSIVHRCGSWDAPLSPWRYEAWRTAEAARGMWFKKVKKAISKGIRRRS